ncbi:MAG: amidohydrolase family protein [Gemmatimonadota bacterium]
MTLRPTLYTARWILPVAHEPLRDAGLLVAVDGRIERLAPRASFTASDRVERVELGDAAILPGLINVHAHPELAAFRGLLDDLPFHQWIPTLIRCKRDAQLSDDDYAAAARWTCVESLRAGITTMGATEDSGAAVAALCAAGMRGRVYLEVFGPAPEQAADSLRELREKVARHAQRVNARVQLGVSPHAPYSVSDELFTAVAAYARSEQLPLATHSAESEAEELLLRAAVGPFAAGLRTRGIAVEARGPSTIELLARTGVLDCAPLIIHGVRLSADDLRLLAEAGATIAHCPVANARLGHGIAPIVEALERGVRVAIGTDSVASNNRIDLLEEAHIAQALQRARLQSASVLPSEQLLRMVTIEAARALGMADRIGSLEPGKDADFCVLALDRAHTVPVAAPLDAVFHAARGVDVIMTVVAGRALYRDGRVATLDEVALGRSVQAMADRLSKARNAQ